MQNGYCEMPVWVEAGVAVRNPAAASNPINDKRIIWRSAGGRDPYESRRSFWRGRAAEDAYQPGGLFVASHHTAGNRRNRSVSAGGALCLGDVCQSEQGRRSERQMDHFGFHVAALAKLDPVVRVNRTQNIVYANSARSGSPLVPE